MDNTFMTIIGIFLVTLLMFVVPLMAVLERNDDVAQTVVQTATAEFVDKISISGLIKPSDYEEYQQKLNSTGNTFDVEIEVQHLDENFGKKNSTTSVDLIGENERYSTFTTEILENMYLNDGSSKNYVLKKGDNVIVTAKNNNKTMAQILRTFIYKVTGQGTYQIGANSSSMVVNNGGGKYIAVDTDISESEFIEADKDYKYYGNKFGDYNILSDCPKNGGLSATDKKSMLLNVTFKINKFESENGGILEQHIVSTAENSGWALRINPNRYIDIVIWNQEKEEYNDYKVEEQIQEGTVYNVTVMYDGTTLKMFLRDLEMERESYCEYTTNIKLNQRDDIPTLIGENPIVRYDDKDEGSYYKKLHKSEADFLKAYNTDWEKNKTSTFDGWVYNVRLWYNTQSFSTNGIKAICNEAIIDTNKLLGTAYKTIDI